jgi:EAL domain-containing protein (putative c-di-GMP-specific phosphodiesterase class I)
MSPNQRMLAIMDAIAVDETGLSFGVLDALRLKCAFQPIFARRGPMLVPIAVSAGFVAQRRGQSLGETELAGLSAAERGFMQALCRSLAIRNLAHIGCDDPVFDLVLDLSEDVSDPEDELRLLLDEAALADIAPDRLCFDLTALRSAPCFAALAMRLETSGTPLALDLAAASRREAGSAAVPGLVRIPPAWTRAIVAEPDLLRLLRLLVTTLRRRGAAVQIEGITDEIQLRAAVTAGADRLQGDFLAPVALAGTDFDASPRAFADFIGGSGNVVPLSA